LNQSAILVDDKLTDLNDLSELDQYSDSIIKNRQDARIQDALNNINFPSVFSDHDDNGISVELDNNQALAYRMLYPDYTTLQNEILDIIKENDCKHVDLELVKQELWNIPHYQIDYGNGRVVYDCVMDLDKRYFYKSRYYWQKITASDKFEASMLYSEGLRFYRDYMIAQSKLETGLSAIGNFTALGLLTYQDKCMQLQLKGCIPHKKGHTVQYHCGHKHCVRCYTSNLWKFAKIYADDLLDIDIVKNSEIMAIRDKSASRQIQGLMYSESHKVNRQLQELIGKNDNSGIDALVESCMQKCQKRLKRIGIKYGKVFTHLLRWTKENDAYVSLHFHVLGYGYTKSEDIVKMYDKYGIVINHYDSYTEYSKVIQHIAYLLSHSFVPKREHGRMIRTFGVKPKVESIMLHERSYSEKVASAIDDNLVGLADNTELRYEIKAYVSSDISDYSVNDPTWTSGGSMTASELKRELGNGMLILKTNPAYSQISFDGIDDATRKELIDGMEGRYYINIIDHKSTTFVPTRAVECSCKKRCKCDHKCNHRINHKKSCKMRDRQFTFCINADWQSICRECCMYYKDLVHLDANLPVQYRSCNEQYELDDKFVENVWNETESYDNMVVYRPIDGKRIDVNAVRQYNAGLRKKQLVVLMKKMHKESFIRYCFKDLKSIASKEWIESAVEYMFDQSYIVKFEKSACMQGRIESYRLLEAKQEVEYILDCMAFDSNVREQIIGSS